MGAERMQREFASQSNVAGAFLIVAKTRIVRHEIYSSASATPVTQLEDIIRSEIGETGAISFARFMELALYHPSHGYYERHLKQTGRDGDFFTSVNVGSLYGELLAVDFARRLQSLKGPVQLIEAAAHDGQLARDILNYLAEYEKEIFRRAEYIIIEPSAARAHKQFDTLATYGGKVRWIR